MVQPVVRLAFILLGVRLRTMVVGKRAYWMPPFSLLAVQLRKGRFSHIPGFRDVDACTLALPAALSNALCFAAFGTVQLTLELLPERSRGLLHFGCVPYSGSRPGTPDAGVWTNFELQFCMACRASNRFFVRPLLLRDGSSPLLLSIFLMAPSGTKLPHTQIPGFVFSESLDL